MLEIKQFLNIQKTFGDLSETHCFERGLQSHEIDERESKSSSRKHLIQGTVWATRRTAIEKIIAVRKMQKILVLNPTSPKLYEAPD